MGWSRGVVTVGQNDGWDNYTLDTSTYENTTILCTPQISSAEFNVVVDNKGHVQKFERLTPFTYDNSSFFDQSTSIASFKSQLSQAIRRTPFTGSDSGTSHSDEHPRSIAHFLIDSTGHGRFCNPSTPPPSFEDAQRGFQEFYSWFAPIVIGESSERIFRSATRDGGRKPQRPGERIFLQNRVSMDPVMFYIATVLLAFSTLASIIIFHAPPKRFLPKLPNTLASEIGFFYASEALGDTEGTAHLSSGMRGALMAKLGWEYGYGRFIGEDGKLHSGVERMGPIEEFREAS